MNNGNYLSNALRPTIELDSIRLEMISLVLEVGPIPRDVRGVGGRRRRRGSSKADEFLGALSAVTGVGVVVAGPSSQLLDWCPEKDWVSGTGYFCQGPTQYRLGFTTDLLSVDRSTER
ncbi:hypothetical protein F1880_008690 [Penicillium rolfsii]|nr:hypothetical protein F1880_008690 [Penicillium rolfsii]